MAEERLDQALVDRVFSSGNVFTVLRRHAISASRTTLVISTLTQLVKEFSATGAPTDISPAQTLLARDILEQTGVCDAGAMEISAELINAICTGLDKVSGQQRA